MRIERDKEGGKALAASLSEALAALLGPPAAEGTACIPVCQRAEPRDCGRHCPGLPEVLSSEPVRFPIEGHIAPLVYELSQLGVFRPCWSCEGHHDHQGEIWKLPRVWFYARSVVHVRLLAEALEKLHIGGRLLAPWRVAVSFSDGDNPDTTFSLEPAAEQGADLEMLQRDVATLARELAPAVRDRARQLSQSVP